jgi:RNA polymerase sigma-70 factor (ECF subfamily)
MANNTADQDAEWNMWFDRHGSRLLLFARQQTRCMADAQDVLQEAIVRSWKASRGAPANSLVCTAIRHAAIDFYRQGDRRRLRELRAAEDTSWFSPATVDSPDQLQVEQLVRSLPDAQQEVVVLRIWNDLSFDEIGRTLAISPNTAASRFRLALQNLRRHLNPEWYAYT